MLKVVHDFFFELPTDMFKFERFLKILENWLMIS